MKYEVKIFKADPKVRKKYGIIANASVILDGKFAINDIVIKENTRDKDASPYVFFPTKMYEKDGEKEYKPVFCPVTAKARTELTQEIIDALDE